MTHRIFYVSCHKNSHSFFAAEIQFLKIPCGPAFSIYAVKCKGGIVVG